MVNHDNAIPNPHEPSKPFTIVNLSSCPKLTPLTYLNWYTQIESLLFGFDLLKFVDGSHPCPPPTIAVPATTEKTEDPNTTPNPAYHTWIRQDKLLLGALLGTLSPTVTSLVVHAPTSYDVWTILATTYANPSRGHILQVKDRLSSITKTNTTISEYMQQIKECTDKLSLMGKTMDHEDIISKVLNGLDYDDYKPIIDSIRARDDPISFEALHEKLILHELSLKNYTSSSPAPASAFAASRRNQQPHRQYNTSNRTSGLLPTPTTTRPPNEFKGRCQWCRDIGHVISHCSVFKELFPSISFPPPPSRQSYSPRPYTNRPPPQAHAATMPSTTPSPWLLDSGATHHITNDLANLSLHCPYDGTDDLIIGDGSTLPIANIGSFSIPSHPTTLHFRQVLHVPHISRNILSVSQFCHDNNACITFLPSSFVVKDLQTGKILLQGPLNHGTYEWRPQPPTTFSAAVSPPHHWHHTLGHPTASILRHLSTKYLLNIPVFHHCNDCQINKSHKLPFAQTSLFSTAPLELVFSDVWTSPLYSHDSFKYYVIFVDHFTKYVWLYPLKRKSDTFPTFSRFRALVEKRFNRPIITLFSDNGGEYQKLTPTLLENGITHLTSPPHTPEHNGYAERRHRHIVETGLSLLTYAKLPLTYWSNAFTTAVYLINRLPTPTLQNRSPYLSLFNTEPNYDKLRPFGCLCYPWLRPYTSHKLEPKSTPCVFLGYSSTQSAYHCLDPSTNKIFTSRHVRFFPDTFPYLSLSSSTDSTTITSSSWCDFNLPILPTPPSSALTPINPATSTSPTSSDSPPITPIHSTTTTNNTSPFASTHHTPLRHPTPPHSPFSSSSGCSLDSPLSTVPATSPDPPSSPPTTPHTSHPTRTIVTRLTNNIKKPNPKYAQIATLPSAIFTPTTTRQALVDPLWRAAMDEEYTALLKNSTWTLVPTQPAYNIVGCKWVFRVKYNTDGTLKQRKARLVAKGFHQRPGIDYVDTFSPVIKPAAIRLILSLVVTNNWPLRQLDVNNAFLQGTLSETVYMNQPPGFVDHTKPHHVCRLTKAIYGLKQAPRAWYTALKTFLLTYGFKGSIADPSLFIYTRGHHKILVLVYVDDIIVTGPSPTILNQFVDSLSHRFSLKDLGPLSLFLGIEVTPNSAGLHLNQTKYIHDLLTRYNMTDCKPCPTPLHTYPSLTRHDGTPLSHTTDYRALVGSLQYLTLTRPDIAFTVNKLAQYMQAPTDLHWSALKRLLRYLHGTIHMGLQVHRSSPPHLHAFCDADWAGDKDDYVSTTGYIIYLGRNPISWTSKKQRALARSSTEAEFRAVADTTAELLWVHNLLTELSITVPHQPVIYCDNLGATHYSANPVFHSRKKHLALAFHFVREHVQNGSLRVQHINGNDQLADILTKPLHRPRLHRLISKIGLLHDRPSCGRILRIQLFKSHQITTKLQEASNNYP